MRQPWVRNSSRSTSSASSPASTGTRENGESAFAPIDEKSFPGKWKVIYFYPKDFTFVCPTEIVGFAKLAQDFADRDAVVLGGSTDNEFSKLGWRRDHKDLDEPQPLAVRRRRPARWSTSSACAMRQEGVALRATFIVDPDNVIQHVSVNNLNVGRNPEEVAAHPRRPADRRAVPVQPQRSAAARCRSIELQDRRG